MDSDGLGKPPGLPSRYRNRPPNLKFLRQNPCLKQWIMLIECYTVNNYANKPCLKELLSFEGCSANMVRIQR
jgi:hypothetical protein